MEIEIKEKIDTLEIIKSCKQELKKTVTIIISTMILIYFIYIYKEPSMFLLFPIYVTPLAYIIFTILCQKYKYEVIFIDTKQIRFSSSYTEKNLKTSMTSFFKIENLKEIYVMEYHQLPPRKFFGITKYKKMTFSKDEEANSYILNLEDCQISFDIIEGEDEEGPWFEVECNIIFF